MTTPFELGVEIGSLAERMKAGLVYGDEPVHVANKPLIRDLAFGASLDVEFADNPTDETWTLATFTKRKHAFGVVEGGKT